MTTTADNGDNVHPTSGSLRSAILQSNAASGPNKILFNLAPNAVISPPSTLPTLTTTVTIDARNAQTGQPNVVLDGSDAVGGSTPADGLDVNAGGCVVEGFFIDNFPGSGIVLAGSGGNTVAANDIGVGTDGTTGEGNLGNGILVTSPHNVIGAIDIPGKADNGVPQTFLANIITANGAGDTPADGILITGAQATGNLLIGNFIGIDSTGSVESTNGNGNDGVQIVDSSKNTIGGTTTGARNVISFNGESSAGTGDGIEIDGVLAAGNLIEGDYIGTNYDGGIDGNSNLLGNSNDGVQIVGAPNNTIGGITSAALNVISGNGDGIEIDDSTATGNLIEGNVIGGGDPTSTFPEGNLDCGIDIVGAPGNTIGGTVSGAGNVIVSNANYGIDIEGKGASANLVAGNVIGLDLDDEPGLGNILGGVQLNGAPNNTIGGSTPGARNVISNNGQNGSGDGVEIEGAGANGNVILGNEIGTNLAGNDAAGNADCGIKIVGSPGNIIGGSSAGDGNVISGNGTDGIFLEVDGNTGIAASNTWILGNHIGVDVTGKISVSNNDSGIEINSVANTTIGGSSAGSGNLISDDGARGILISGAGASGTLILGNDIGVGAGGLGSFGNIESGIVVSGAPLTTIGGVVAGDRNVISGNGGDGIYLVGAGTTGTSILGNYIGVDGTGLTRAANLLNGIQIYGSSSNTVGGTVDGARNVIDGNNLVGIYLQANGTVGSDNNLVIGNYVGVNSSGSAGYGNITQGVAIYRSSGNTIGGTTAGARNIISNNGTQGIKIIGSSITDPNNSSVVIGNTGSGNLIEGNYIGSSADGTDQLPNLSDGIDIQGATGDTIGGTTPGSRNVIYDNYGNGINLTSGANSNLVEGNFIGVGALGQTGLGNHGSGVLIYSSTDNTIGGTVAGAGNLLSNNQVSGVDLSSDSMRNLVEGNLIGVDATGRFRVGNGLNGITIENGANNNTIGGTGGSATRNVISGNTDNGLAIIQGSNGQVFSNLVLGNFIGTDISGSTAVGSDGKALGNLSDGVLIVGASSNSIGGNVISGNGSAGINLSGGVGASGNQVFSNEIGTDATGTRVFDSSKASLGNQGNGVTISNAPGNTIGGLASGMGNLISGNSGIGVQITGVLSAGNVLQGNKIGVDLSGTLALGNTSDGVQIFDSGGNLLGGLEPGAGNLISANQGSGVHLIGSSNQAYGNALFANVIGSDISTSLATDSAGKSLGNAGAGVLLNQVVGTFLYANIIDVNKGAGVDIESGSANLLTTNFIGTNVFGSSGLGNIGAGVVIDNSASNTIGGLAATSRNILSGNQTDGIELTGPETTGNFVVGDWIGLNGSGSSAVGNGADGVLINNAGAGNNVSFDVISANAGAGVDIMGTSTGNTTVQANLIGTDSTGLVALGNSVGIYLDNVPAITIGGTSPAARNIISGNTQIGIDIFQVPTSSSVSPNSTLAGDTIEGNWIGPNAAGTNIPTGSQQQSGVFIDNAVNNVVGGTVAGAGNVISGNNLAGVYIFGQANSDDVNNLVEGNILGAFPGVSVSKVPVVQGAGVLVNTSAGNTIGGSVAGAGNLFAGNQIGVEIVGATSPTSVKPTNTIQQNILIDNAIGIFLNQASNNLVGGTLATQANIIQSNSLEGLSIFGALATGNKVEGNNITSNVSAGVYLDGAVNNMIGGTAKGAGNVISKNGASGSSDGVGVFLNDGAAGNTIARNKIQNNTGYGVFLYNSGQNVPGVSRVGPTKNTFGANRIADFREYTGPTTTASSPKTKKKSS